MGSNDVINKKIKVSVDAKQWEALLKSIKDSEGLIKTILETQNKINKALNIMNKAQKDSNKKEKEKLDTLKKEESTLERINRLKDAYNKSKEKKDLELTFEKRDLEKPKKSLLERYQSYKGIGGAFKLMGERAEEAGQAKVDDYDRQLLIEKQKRADLLKLANSEKDEEKQRKLYEDVAAKDEDIRKLEKGKSKSIGDPKSEVNKYKALSDAAKGVDKALGKLKSAIIGIVTNPLKKLGEAFKNAVHDIIEFRTGVATFNTSNSLITNSAAREQQLKYGLSASQNYGFTKAKEMLNIQSDEDLMYMNAEQRDRLLGYMEKYSSWFDQMNSSGVLQDIQEMQLEFNELKEELAMEFLQWVAENKETIMTIIRGIFEFVKFIANKIIDIVNFFSKLTGGKAHEGFYSEALSSDTINNNNNSKSTNITINANTTNNATGVLGSQEAFNQYSEENFKNLSKQLIEMIGG